MMETKAEWEERIIKEFVSMRRYDRRAVLRQLKRELSLSEYRKLRDQIRARIEGSR